MAKKGLQARLERRAKRARLELPSLLAERLGVYFELLQRWNKQMNLTNLDDRDAGVDRLIIEPLVAASHLKNLRARVVDIGSGGGSPAIPLRLAMEGGSMLMVESKTRKAAFLREVIRQLELEDVEVATARFEELLTRAELHEAFDALSLRAVRIDERVLRGIQAFVRPEGELLLFRGTGGGMEQEGVEPPLVWEATYPLVESLRSRLVVLRKLDIGRRAKKKRI